MAGTVARGVDGGGGGARSGKMGAKMEDKIILNGKKKLFSALNRF
jgi:hypothetical protein